MTPDERVEAAHDLHRRVQAQIDAFNAKQQGYSVAGNLPPPTPGMRGPQYHANGGNIEPDRQQGYSVGATGVPAWAPLVVVGIFGYLMATGLGYAKSSRRAA